MHLLECEDIADHGELIIAIPDEPLKAPDPAEEAEEEDVLIDICSVTPTLKRSASKTMPDWPDTAGMRPRICIRVGYRVVDPTAGVQFTGGKGSEDGKASQMFVCTAHGDAGLWFPCLDSLDQRFTMEMELTAPAQHTVVATGELQGQVYADEAQERKTWLYSWPRPVMARSVGLALGPFVVLADDEDGLSLTHFCLPRGVGSDAAAGRVDREADGRASSKKRRLRHGGQPEDQALAVLSHTVQHTREIIKCFEHFLGAKYPYKSYKQVFVQEAYQEHMAFAGMSVLSSSLLTDATLIDQAFLTRRALARSVALSWVMSALLLRSHSDLWIANGIVEFLTMLYIEKAFGTNERVFRTMEQAVAVADEDKDTRGPLGEEDPFICCSRPLAWNGALHSSELYGSTMSRKAGVVMRMLQTKLGAINFRTVLQQIWKESAMVPDLSLGADRQAPKRDVEPKPITSKKLLKKSKTGRNEQDLKNFFEQWVYCDGYPELTCTVSYDKKNKKTVIGMTQKQKHLKFQGPIKFLVHERERTADPEERIDELTQTFNVVCHSKLLKNRTRRNIDNEGVRSLADILQRYGDTPVKWVRVDPTGVWFRPVVVEQKEVMLVHQLLEDADVTAQYLAIQAVTDVAKKGLNKMFRNQVPVLFLDCQYFFSTVLCANRLRVGCFLRGPTHTFKERPPPELVPRALKQVLNDPAVYYHVRVQAGRSLIERVKPQASNKILELIRIFKKHYYKSKPLLLPNDFSDWPDYFVKKALPGFLSETRDSAGLSHSAVKTFILDLIRENDNSLNPYSDVFYMAALLRSLGMFFLLIELSWARFNGGSSIFV